MTKIYQLQIQPAHVLSVVFSGMKTTKIGIYVQNKYAKPAYVKEYFDRRGWPGLMMIRDQLLRDGWGYCRRTMGY